MLFFWSDRVIDVRDVKDAVLAGGETLGVGDTQHLRAQDICDLAKALWLSEFNREVEDHGNHSTALRACSALLIDRVGVSCALFSGTGQTQTHADVTLRLIEVPQAVLRAFAGRGAEIARDLAAEALSGGWPTPVRGLRVVG
jgi:hypothetical protein